MIDGWQMSPGGGVGCRVAEDKKSFLSTGSNTDSYIKHLQFQLLRSWAREKSERF